MEIVGRSCEVHQIKIKKSVIYVRITMRSLGNILILNKLLGGFTCWFTTAFCPMINGDEIGWIQP